MSVEVAIALTGFSMVLGGLIGLFMFKMFEHSPALDPNFDRDWDDAWRNR